MNSSQKEKIHQVNFIKILTIINIVVLNTVKLKVNFTLYPLILRKSDKLLRHE